MSDHLLAIRDFVENVGKTASWAEVRRMGVLADIKGIVDTGRDIVRRSVGGGGKSARCTGGVEVGRGIMTLGTQGREGKRGSRRGGDGGRLEGRRGGGDRGGGGRGADRDGMEKRRRERCRMIALRKKCPATWARRRRTLQEKGRRRKEDATRGYNSRKSVMAHA